MVISVLPVAAQEQDDGISYNLVHLSEQVEQVIDNDLLVVTMNSVAEAKSGHDAARIVNRDMAWALKQCHKFNDVKSRTMNYQTRPRYSKKAIIGWYAEQQLLLESEQSDMLASLVGTLQQKLKVISMHFTVTPAKKKDALDKLTTEGLRAFRAKALLIVKAVGARDYRLVDLTVGDENQYRPYDRAFASGAVSYSKGANPAVQAGESKLTVRISGTIQLLF